MSALRDLIEAIPDHAIGGYEWECYSCHYHGKWELGHECYKCHRLITIDNLDGKYWESGDPASNCSEDDLVARRDVLAALALIEGGHG